MVESVLYFIWFAFFFLLYLVFIPAKLMGRPLWGENAGENALKALIASYLSVISCIYLLGLLHIYNTVTLIIALLAVALVYLKLVKHVSYWNAAQSALRWLALVGSGQYKLGLLARQAVGRRMQSCKEALQDKKWRPSPTQAAAYIVVLAALGVLIWRRWPLAFTNYSYSYSDIYVHNDWINFLEQGDIFCDGVYPFGMHNMISMMHKLTGLHINIVMRYFGAVNCLLMVVVLWFFSRRVFRSRAAAVLPVVIYCVTDYAIYAFGNRAMTTLPQEFGALFLLPCVYFLGKYIQDKKREDGLYFAFSAALTLSMHFYTVIMAVILCACCCLAFIRAVLKLDMLKRLISLVTLIAMLSILPLVLGLVSGKPWQGSMNWAVSVISSSMNQTEETDAAETEPIETEEPDGEAAEEFGLLEKLVQVFKFQTAVMNADWGYVLWFGMGIFVVFFVVMLCRKKLEWGGQMCAGVWLYLLIMVLMGSSKLLGIPEIMYWERIAVFVGYVGPIMLAFPLEALFRALPGRTNILGTLGAYGAVGVLVYGAFFHGHIAVQTYFDMQYSLAAEACVKVEKEFPKGTWTIVSPVDELALLRNGGYHYELWEFITSMERYQEDMYLEIPTKYAFFVLEKQPIRYYESRLVGEEYELPPLDKADADQAITGELLGITENNLTDYYKYIENRRMLEAKLACWLEEYSRAFPDQMEVYMEDEKCVVYKFEQNLFMPNNLAIDYGYNVISELDYYEQLRVRMLERGEDVTEVDEKLAQLRAEEG